MDAFIVIDKPRGISSQTAVSRLRRALGVAKAGHTGTLDPLATGVLPVALGEATKVIPYLDEDQKVYRVEGLMGIATDTYDAEGRETHRAERVEVSREALEEAVRGFLGEQDQMPPVYSAIKKAGKPLYSYARQGQEVEVPTRKVRMDRLDLESFDGARFSLRVECSKGTYIRSLVHDLGLRLGCWAHVTELRRLRSGPFSESQALPLEGIVSEPALAKGRDLSIESCLEYLPKLSLESELERDRVLSGVPLARIKQALGNTQDLGKTLALAYEGRIYALILAQAGGDFTYGRVLNRVGGL
ncbi:MAG: tRNA pseudouridine(55) synthase TruB [Deltaproteobacteria bacterium]|nr:tRNA pseudouridine(55) synthase TruB [Deltaproteobacteria bacterium]